MPMGAALGRVVAAVMREGWLFAMVSLLWLLLLVWEVFLIDLRLFHLPQF